VAVFDRNAANKEKQVDTSLATLMVEDCDKYMKPQRHDMAILVAGDGISSHPSGQSRAEG
jgi:hypothetical protein